MQISGAPSVGLLPVLRLALQVLGTLAFLNPSLRFFHSTRLLLRLHSGVWKVVLPKKAVASVDFICYLSSLRLLLYAVLCSSHRELFSLRVVAKGEG